MMPTPEVTPAPTAEIPGPELFMTVLKAADWAATVAWYVENLCLLKVHDDPERGFALLAAGNGRLAIQADPAPTSERHQTVRLVFQVPDLDEIRNLLETRGVTVTSPSENRDEGYREILLQDPEGTPLTLFSWTEEAQRRRFSHPPEE
jgi:hypothetical protein